MSESKHCQICNTDELDNQKYDEPLTCNHYTACSKCLWKNNYKDKKLHLYYGQCIYCIMDGILWNEEWDSWKEISSRVMELFDFGIKDSKTNDEPYKPKRKKEIYYKLPHSEKSEIDAFYQVYKKGFEIGKNKI